MDPSLRFTEPSGLTHPHPTEDPSAWGWESCPPGARAGDSSETSLSGDGAVGVGNLKLPLLGSEGEGGGCEWNGVYWESVASIGIPIPACHLPLPLMGHEELPPDTSPGAHEPTAPTSHIQSCSPGGLPALLPAGPTSSSFCSFSFASSPSASSLSP